MVPVGSLIELLKAIGPEHHLQQMFRLVSMSILIATNTFVSKHRESSHSIQIERTR